MRDWRTSLPQIEAVVPRESGVSSAPRLLGSLIDVSGYWIAHLRGRRLQGVAPTCPRHCERSEAIHSFFARRDGLLRCARNDGAKRQFVECERAILSVVPATAGRHTRWR